VYALAVPEQIDACELRVSGEQNRLLETIDLASLQGPATGCSSEPH